MKDFEIQSLENDHRHLNNKLNAFYFSEDVGQGLPLLLPYGAKLRGVLQNHCQQLLEKHNYVSVCSPHIGHSKLWEISGHIHHFKENMFPALEFDNESYFLKPMNCPFHMMIFAAEPRSYRDLPMRLSEFGQVYRYERSGSLHGLARVRSFVQDDAHIFCSPSQALEEVKNALSLALQLLKNCGFENPKVYFASRPQDSVLGSEDQWKHASHSLVAAAEALGVPWELDEGGGAFYGPKLDVKVQDSNGKEWQLSSIQFDFNLPKKFQLKFLNDKGKHEEPIIIHRAFFGSLERFIALLLEHWRGALPFWLSPWQVDVVALDENCNSIARHFFSELLSRGIRPRFNSGDKSLSSQLKKLLPQKSPYIAVIGEKEMKHNQVSLRQRGSRQHICVDFNEAISAISESCRPPSI